VTKEDIFYIKSLSTESLILIMDFQDEYINPKSETALYVGKELDSRIPQEYKMVTNYDRSTEE